MTFGTALARLRRSRGWSQEALGLRAGLSQRHISFLETGRSKPGQQSLDKLVSAMALKGWEQRSLLQTLAPSQATGDIPSSDDTLILSLIDRFSRWPAYAFRPDGTLAASNAAMQSLLASAGGDRDLWKATAPSAGANIYDIVFHPDGLVRWLKNPEEVIPETLRRFRIEAAQDAALLPVLERLESYPSVHEFGRADAVPSPVLVERYRIDGKDIAIISVLSHLASPGEPELDALRIESFVPADEASRKLLEEVGDT